jgi:hypothetical protein
MPPAFYFVLMCASRFNYVSRSHQNPNFDLNSNWKRVQKLERAFFKQDQLWADFPGTILLRPVSFCLIFLIFNQPAQPPWFPHTHLPFVLAQPAPTFFLTMEATELKIFSNMKLKEDHPDRNQNKSQQKSVFIYESNAGTS